MRMEAAREAGGIIEKISSVSGVTAGYLPAQDNHLARFGVLPCFRLVSGGLAYNRNHSPETETAR
jgi:hypothetical protein